MAADRSRPLVASAYGVAVLMLAVAAADVLGRILPLRLDQAPWRLGVVGVVTLSLPTMLLAVLVAALAAWRLEHRRVLRTIAILAAASSVLLVLVLPFFALDVIELRRLVQPDGRASFHATMARAALTVLAAAAVAAWVAFAAWKAAGRRPAAEGRSRGMRSSRTPDGELVRQG